MIATRRQFLVGGLRVAAAVPIASQLAHARAATFEDDRTLVVLQLSGGNDGLNTVVPWRQDEYFRARPTLGVDPKTLHRLDDDHGLHPALAPLGELFDEGQLAVVHGAGYPAPDRSHFRSMEVWHTADPVNPPGETGWLGRLADSLALKNPGAMSALHVGDGNLPLALFGRDYFAPTVRDPKGFRLESLGGAFERGRDELLNANSRGGDLEFLREAARSSYRAAERMSSMADANPATAYPGTELGRRLNLVARLVSGGFGTRIFHVELGGFDTHAAQRATHEALLAELGNALHAFWRDLEQHGASKRVAVLVFSEFGRRVRENGSKGTDHGAGAPLFVLGAKGGMYGTPPDLRRLEEGDVPYTTDFREVYADLAKPWMGLAPPTDHRGLGLF